MSVRSIFIYSLSFYRFKSMTSSWSYSAASWTIIFLPKQSYLLLIDPIVLSGLPLKYLAFLEPEGDLLLSILDAVRAVAYVTANIDGIIATVMLA
jgi:hypothetical protein